MVRQRAVRCLLIVAATSLTVACRADDTPGTRPSAGGSSSTAVIAVIPGEQGPLARALIATATDIARPAGFTVRSFVPTTVSNAEQARLLGEAIATKVRAIVIAPVDYSGLLPYLRAAHDAQVPVVLTGTPRDRLNPSFVASFVAPDQASLDDRTAAELTRLLNAASGDVAVISAQPATRTAGASIAGLKRALQRARPNLRLLAVDVDTASADRAASQVTQLFMTRPRLAGVVAIDVFATQALRAQLATLARRRPAVVITSVTSASLGLLSRSLVDAVVGTDFCATARSAMTNALAAAKNDVTAINPGPVVALRTITRTTVGTVATTCS